VELLYLNEHPLLCFLDKAEIAKLNTIAIGKDFMAHDTIIRVNDRSRDLICIDEGSVSVQVEKIDGSIIEMARLHDGSLIGEMNFIIPTRRTANVVSITEIYATIYPYQRMMELFRDETAIAAKVFAALNVSLASKYWFMVGRLC